MKTKNFVLASLCQCLAVTILLAQDATSGITKQKAALAIAEKTGDQAKIADASGRLAFEQAMGNDFFEAITNAQKSIDIFQNLNKPKDLARCYGTMLWVHNAMHNNDKVEEYAQKTLVIGRAEKDTFIVAASLDALANIYDSKGDYNKAIATYREAIQLLEATGEASGSSHNSLASTYYKMSNWSEGLKQNLLASKMLLEEGDTLRYTTSIYNQALANGYLNNFSTAEKLLREADALTNYMAIPEANRDMYLANSMFWGQKGDYKKAYAAHILFYKSDSSMTSETHHQQFAQLETAFHTKEKEQENLKLSNKLQQQYLLFAAIVVALLFLIGFIYLQRKRLKIKNDLLVKEQLLAQKELDTHIDLLKEKTDAIEQLKNTIEKRENFDDKENTIAELLNASIFTEEQWLSFKYKFERVHPDFFAKLQEAVPDVTEAEKRLSALTKLGISGTQIASMLGISPESVTKTRYRLRKKMEGGKLDRVLAEI